MKQTTGGRGMYTQQSMVTNTKDLEICNRVFVYGSLKKGSYNNSILGDSELLETTRTVSGFCLGDVGFPYAFPSDVTPEKYKKLLYPVWGEVYDIDNEYTFYSLDCLEGYPSHYNRRLINLQSGIRTWMYVQEDWSNAARCDACKLKEGAWLWDGK